MTDHLTPVKRSWNMSRIRSKNTKPELMVRKVLAQYNDFSKTFGIQPLLTYQPSPFTIFYIVSTQNQNVNTLSYDAINAGKLTNRQYYLKFQYLF
jgi:hypothetical protein